MGRQQGYYLRAGDPAVRPLKERRNLCLMPSLNQWESGLPKADIRHLVSLLGTKFHDGLSEFWVLSI
jgi:hypothetical protein